VISSSSTANTIKYRRSYEPTFLQVFEVLYVYTSCTHSDKTPNCSTSFAMNFVDYLELRNDDGSGCESTLKYLLQPYRPSNNVTLIGYMPCYRGRGDAVAAPPTQVDNPTFAPREIPKELAPLLPMEKGRRKRPAKLWLAPGLRKKTKTKFFYFFFLGA